MSREELRFWMGRYEARFPTDRHYARNHMWAQRQGPDRWRFGFSAYAVRLLQDVYFLDWHFEPGTPVRQGDQIGEIESSKAESLLYAPVTGRMVQINESLLDDPSLINVDTYRQGWLFEMESQAPEVLSPQQYLDHLAESWKSAQRLIKGQVNE